MEFLVPYTSVRQSPAVKAKLKSKSSKLSLKDREKAAQSYKENKGPALPLRNRHLPKVADLNSGKDLFEGLISSDESDREDKLLGDSISFEGSQLQLPKAESTRLDINVRHSNESNLASYFSCKSRITPPTDSSPDSEEQEGACEESIICISDDESLPLPKFKKNLNIEVPESTDSDSTNKRSKLQSHTESIDKTIILDSSSEDDSFVLKKHYVGKTMLSSLNSLSKHKEDQWRNIVIPTSSSCSDESHDVIDSSLHAPAKKKEGNVDTPVSSKSLKKTYHSLQRREIPETSEEETSPQEQEEISPRTLAAEKLSETKVNDIQRWINGNDSAGFESIGTDSKDEKSSRTSTKSPQKQKDSGSSSVDSFDAFINSGRKQLRKTPGKSSFIVDDSSSDDSFSNYRKVLTSDIKKDVKDIERTPLGILTGKPTFRAGKPKKLQSDSDSSGTESDACSSSSSEWDPDFSRDKKRGRQPGRKIGEGKPLKPKPKQAIPDSRKDGSNFDAWTRLEKPDDTSKRVKKYGNDTPSTLKKPVDDTPRAFKKYVNETPRTLKEPVSDTPRTFKKPVDDTPRAFKKPVDDTPRPFKKPVNDTPRTLKKPVGDTPQTLKKSDKEYRTPTVKPRTGSKNAKVEDLKKPATPYSPIRTFLTSLSGPAKDPSLRNHPEASIYFKNYKSKREELAKRLLKLFNREVFDSRLPDDMVLEWSGRMLSTAGFCSCKLIRKPNGPVRTAKITLSTKILDSPDRLRDTLIHEMCHAAVWLLNQISGGHGPFWKAWARKAERRFPELPEIKVCHEYSVETKFTYRCTNCGYRHSKSINLQTQRCGHCYGTFELLVNRGRNHAGSTTVTPATPKPPTGFALFVKENYGVVKKEHSDKKHGDIMKLLGQKFAEVKISK